MNVLAVGAHPDDIELGCGGAILKHLALGNEVYILIMTKGNRGNHTPGMQECFASLEFLGVKRENIFFAGFEDGYLQDNYETVNLIESYVNKFEIDRIYTHYPHDRHQDHRNCSYAVSSAARKIPEIFLFEGPSTKTPFEPHYFIEISEEQVEKKVKSLNYYQTQVKKGIVNTEIVRNLASVYGLKNNKRYAEAFAINHLIKGENDV